MQDHIPVKIRNDLGMTGVEALWLQVYTSHQRPTLACCCYRPPSSNIEYLNNICTMLHHATDTSNDIFVLADMNIDWFSDNCSLKRALGDAANICNLSQVINLPTRISINSDGSITSTCIDHFFTNCEQKCSKAVPLPVGFSDHNIIALAVKTKAPKAGPKVIYKRIYRTFSESDFVSSVENIEWDGILEKLHAEAALESFMKLFSTVCDRHAPIKRLRWKKASWLDDELRNCMKRRDQLKKHAITSGCLADWKAYRLLRNKVTKLNRQKKKQYYKSKCDECNGDSKKLRRTLNEVMGRSKNGKTPSFYRT